MCEVGQSIHFPHAKTPPQQTTFNVQKKTNERNKIQKNKTEEEARPHTLTVTTGRLKGWVALKTSPGWVLVVGHAMTEQSLVVHAVVLC